MAQIQPIQIWYQGEQREATILNVYTNFSNNKDSANLQYQLIELIVTPDSQNSNVLNIGYLTISGFDYEAWNTSPDRDSFIYQWVATKLNLVLIP
jgi:hypothetical protein